MIGHIKRKFIDILEEESKVETREKVYIRFFTERRLYENIVGNK